MNWYLVYGKRFVDMMGNSDYDLLGVIELDDDRDEFVSERPTKVGSFYFNETYYDEFEYEKMPILHQVDLQVFK